MFLKLAIKRLKGKYLRNFKKIGISGTIVGKTDENYTGALSISFQRDASTSSDEKLATG